MPRSASATIPETALCEAAIKHVVNDYFVLLWAEWAQRQTDSYEDIVRTHIAFSYFLPHRAFGDFFGNSRSLPPRGVTDRDLDIHAIDFSDGNYVDLAWQEWESHMNTHLFHLNYFRTRSTRGFNPSPVVAALFAEFQENWKNFIDGLRPHFVEPFRLAIQVRSKEYPQLIAYSHK